MNRTERKGLIDLPLLPNFEILAYLCSPLKPILGVILQIASLGQTSPPHPVRPLAFHFCKSEAAVSAPGHKPQPPQRHLGRAKPSRIQMSSRMVTTDVVSRFPSG